MREWIATLSLRGDGIGVLLKELTQVGWPVGDAVNVLESVLISSGQSLLPGITRPVPILLAPEPELMNSPTAVDLGDRTVRIALAMSAPRLVVLADFLSEDECQQLIGLARPRLSPSSVVDYASGGSRISPARTSMGMCFSRGENELVARIEARIHRFVRWPVENGEAIQAMQYEPGTSFTPHHDFFDAQQQNGDVFLKHGGQRLATFLMYLKAPEAGGATLFTDVGLEIASQRGSAVFFSYPEANEASKTRHGGAPVVSGEKWIATRWLREQKIAYQLDQPEYKLSASNSQPKPLP